MDANLFTSIGYAARSLRRAKSFTITAVLSLALGLGATTTMIAVIDAVYFRRLPYRNAEHVVVLEEVKSPDATAAEGAPSGTSMATFSDWRTQTQSYEGLAAVQIVPAQLTGTETGDIDDGAQVSANFFSVLGVAPRLGRTFTEQEEDVGASVVVLSYDVWQARFGGDPSVIGQQWRVRLLLTGMDPLESYTIIGVMPRGVSFPWKSKIWAPLKRSQLVDRRARRLFALGLLRRGRSAAAAEAELKTVTRRLTEAFPSTMRGRTAQATPLRDWMIAFNPTAVSNTAARESSTRFVLLAVAGFVLLLAAMNVANLLLIRVAARKSEMVLRTALGASRAHLARLMLVESLMVSVIGCSFGVLIAIWAVRIANARLGLTDAGIVTEIDVRVVAVAFALAIVTGAFIGALPAATLSRGDLHGALRARTPAGQGDARTGVARSALVVGQVAAALLLANAAGLLGRDFIELTRNAPGYDPENLVAIMVPPGVSRRSDAQLVVEDATERARRIPGVAGAVQRASGGQHDSVWTEDERVFAGPALNVVGVGPQFFRVLGIPLVGGRRFTNSDRRGAPDVVVVNRTAAHAFWPGERAIGKSLVLASGDSLPGGVAEVIGVVADSRVLADPRSDLVPTVYRPVAQAGIAPGAWLTVFARTTRDPAPLLPTFNRLAAELHTGPGWQGWGARVAVDDLAHSLVGQRLDATALATFSILGLLLAAMGVYGVVATQVAYRTKEIGVRVTLGARAGDVFGLVSRQGAILAASGVTAGLLASLALTRLLRSVLTVTSPTDPSMLGASAVLLVVVVLVAGIVPVRRALQVDPAIALREP